MLRKLRTSKAFTLAEIMIVVAIIAIISAIGIGGILSQIKSIRQMKLDTTARTIYVAAQNRLTELYSSGNTEWSTAFLASKEGTQTGSDSIDAVKVTKKPSDWGDSDFEEGDLYAVVSDDTNDYTKRALFPDGTINEELFEDNWVVEFNPNSGYVYAVFFSEKLTSDQYYSDDVSASFSDQGVSVKDIARANKESRISNFYSLGGVGYYGGAISINEKYDVQDLTNNIQVSDGAELKLTFDTSIPPAYQKKYVDLEVVFTGLVSGSTQTYTFTAKSYGSRKSVDLIVDSLNTKKYGSFYQNFCQDGRSAASLLNLTADDSFNIACKGYNGNFIPGENVRVTLVSKVRDDAAAKSVTSEIIINSLFSCSHTNNMGAGPISGGGGNNQAKAYIRNGRHLQNLDTATSHVNVNDTAAAGKSLIFTEAIQTEDIDLDLTKTSGDWVKAYGTRPFTPITNSQLSSYNGSGKKINRLTAGSVAESDIADSGKDIGKVKTGAAIIKPAEAGLFADFAGSSLSNIVMTGTKAQGTDNAGAIAAVASGAALTVDNCQVYLQRADYTDIVNKIALTSDELAADTAAKTVHDEARISSETGNAGGLIGRTGNAGSGTATALTINKSFAATIIDGAAGNSAPTSATAGQSNAGGLVGYSTGNLNITASYADCYIAGSYIGGLAGYSAGGSNVIRGSYSAGFAALSTESTIGEVSTGFLSTDLNAGEGTVQIVGSYTIFDTGTVKAVSQRWHMTNTELNADGSANNATKAESCYYSNTADLSNDISGAQYSTASKLKESTITGTDGSTSDGPILVMNNANGGVFKLNSSDTTPYNVRMGMQLTSYDYPHVTGLKHYGDWSETEIKPGTLVYYETYKDGKWGFAGGGINTLRAKTDDTATYVVDDGYALIYSADNTEDAKQSADIYFNQTTAGTATVSLSALTAAPTAVNIANPGSTGWDKAIFRTLGKSIDNAGLAADGTTITAPSGLSDYYLPIVVKSRTDTLDYYYFNPYFAKTVVSVTEFGADTMPKFSTDESNKTSISVRTPRQLYLMSCFYEQYADKTKLCVFDQELKLDYAVYDWSAQGDYFANAFAERSASFELNSRTITVNTTRTEAPIGSEAKPFEAEYNGHGYIISGMSIAAAAGQQTVSAGLFGTVSGTLSNIVYTADYSAKSSDNYAVNDGYSISGNGSKYYVGAIAGHLTSTGSIDNTAAAGLVINSYAYDNAQINAGGLVGLNEGSISCSSADLPVMMIRTNGGAGAYAAGFAGINRGSIESSYCLSYINISRAASDSIGQVYLGGFAARNNGGASISYSYCATATVSENIDDDKRSGFTLSGGGNVSSSCYVDGGNYYYVDSIYAFNVGDEVKADTSGTAVTGNQLASTSTDSQVAELTDMVRNGAYGDADNAYNCANTTAKVGEGTKYPYPAIVKDAEGNHVHYGEWIFDSDYSDAGFVYWEKEEGGSNRGYHFYIIDGEGNEHSTLCTAHDDGGVISDYGYGYYYLKSSATGEGGSTSASASWENVNIGNKSGFANAEPDTAAQNELTKQFANKYTFVLYKTTKDADKSGTSTHEKADKGMFLINSTYNINGVDVTSGAAYAVCELKVTKGDAESRQLTYVFCPFFAKSMLLYSYNINAGSDTATDMAYPGTADGTEHDTQKKQYENDQLTRAAAGTTGATGNTASGIVGVSDSAVSGIIGASDAVNTAGTVDASGTVTASTDTGDTIEIPEYMKQGIPFEIRSVYQLQNINWRTDKYDAVTEVGSSDAKVIGTSGKPNYLYLAWYGYNDPVYQNGSELYKNGVPDDDVYNYYWKQTHDANGKGKELTPIGSLYDTRPSVPSGQWGSGYGTRTEPYAAFFNGDYNGDSYVIRNINISSTAQTVGLFGIEVAAKLRNIILYSDSNNVIESKGDTSLWYMIGSLAGLAGKGTVENCVVSGYTVLDNRTACSDGDATIGAFIGLCATSMSRCISNNDLILNSTHGYTQRVGGMVGIITGKISSSYCGGSITNKTKTSNKDAGVYIAGMIGGEWFRGAGLEALTGAGNFEDQSSSMKPEIENSYSFIKLPNKSGNIKNVKVFATTADLDKNVREDDYGATPVTITVKNCYYYGMYAGNAEVNAVIAKTKNYISIYDLKYLDANGNNISNPAGTMALDYAAMAGSADDTASLLYKLNAGGGGFGKVTTAENGGQIINGKYSFPGSDKELVGQNYPFPTIVTQEDPFDSNATVNVHYGQWPKGTELYSDASSMTLDLLSSTGGSNDCTADVKVKFYDNSTATAMNSEPTLSFKSSGTDSSDIVKYTLTPSTTDGGSTVPQYYVLTLDGWNEGYETINVNYTYDDGNTYTTVINVAVTAEMSIKVWSTDSTNSNPKVGDTASYTANVYDANDTAIKDISRKNWEASTANSSIAEVDKDKISLDTNGNIVIPVIGNKAGRTTLTITAKDILPKNHGKYADDNRVLSQTYSMDVSVTSADATTAKVQLYAYDTRLDSDSDHPVAVDSGNAISSDSTSAANFAYWTEQVANDSTINGGKTFAGWVTEDGTSVTADTTFSSTTNVYASWRCTKVTFTDGGAETGSRYYHGGSFYTDSTLRTKASAAPQPLNTHGADETFTGYWTAADGATSGSQVTDTDCGFITNALSSPRINGVETTVDENTAALTVYAVFTTDTAAP